MDHSNVFESIPIKIKNSALLTTFLHEQKLNSQPVAAPSLFSTPSPNFSITFPDLPLQPADIEPYFERHLEELGDTLEMLGQEQWRFNGWQRNLGKEQQKFWQLVQKRKYENVQRQKEGIYLFFWLTTFFCRFGIVAVVRRECYCTEDY